MFYRMKQVYETRNSLTMDLYFSGFYDWPTAARELRKERARAEIILSDMVSYKAITPADYLKALKIIFEK